jgi:hypothetical protein
LKEPVTDLSLLRQRPIVNLLHRCVVRPDRAQALLLDRLGLKLPERLRPPLSVTKM